MNKKLLLIATIFMVNFGTFIQAVPSSEPTISRVYGDRFIGEIDDSNSVGAYGTLDPSFGSSGSLALSGAWVTGNAVCIKTLSDGTFLVAIDNGTNSYIVKYTATGALYSTTGGSFGTSSVVTLATLHGLSSGCMNIDAQGRILVTGSVTNGSTGPWIRRLTTTGTTDVTFNFTDAASWSAMYAIAEQASGEILILGANNAGPSKLMLARYFANGAIDTTFAASGYMVFDGGGTSPQVRPNAGVITTVYVTIASDDSIFVGYRNFSDNHAYLAKFTANGLLATGFGLNGILGNALGSLALPNADVVTVLDNAGNINIVGQPGGTYISVYCYNPSTGAAAGFTSATISDGANNLIVHDAIATTDGNLLICGYDTSVAPTAMRVTSLTSGGVLDTDFNGGAGYIEFTPTGSSSALMRGAIGPDGRIYVAGLQGSAPYVSRLFGTLTNLNAFISQVAQQPATNEQGTIDYTFGGVQTKNGIVYNYNGLYGVSLQQTANAITELVSGKFIVGMSGYTNTSATSNMMLQRINATGTLDTTFGSSTGFVTLPLNGLTGMVMTSVIENLTGNTLLVSGYSSTSGTLGLYTSAGAELEFVSDTTILKVLGVATQGTQRVIAFEQTLDGIHGQIAAYLPDLSGLDTTFHATGGTPGKITPSDFGLTNMGPLYGYAIDAQDNIYIAYKNASTGNVDVAKIYSNGSGLITAFGTNGIISNVFGSTITNVNDVRIALDEEAGNIVVAAVLSSSTDSYTLKRFFTGDGTLDTTFGSAGTFSQDIGTAAVINNLGMLNNNKIIVTGYDNSTDDSMVVMRVTAEGTLDTTFNSQGTTPGITSLQIGNATSNYTVRSATSMAIQSTTGNMIVSAYEQQSGSLSVPMVIRLYGQAGTTLVYQYPRTGTTADAGTIDTTYGTDGALDLTSLIAAGVAKTIYAYPLGNTYDGYLLVGIDTGSALKIARIRQSNNSLDTTFGNGGITTIASTTGLQVLTVDAQNNVLVAGGTGWAFQMSANGSTATSPNGTTLIAFASSAFTAYYDIKQQESGRYIVAGTDSNGKAAVIAFQDHLVAPASTLAIDTTFNAMATTGSATAGIYELTTTSSTTAPSLVINSDDTILVVYQDTTVKIAKLMANGSGLDTAANGGMTFGTAGIKNTTITASNSAAIRCAIDSNGSVIVASSVGGTSVSLVRYLADGTTDTGFNVTGAINTITPGLLGSVGVTLTSLIIDASNQILFFGYNTGGANGKIFTGRLTSAGVLDTNWNATPISPDVAGINTFTLDGSTNVYGSAIFFNGEIYLAGGAGSTVPLLMRMFGDNYIGQLAQQPLQVAAGIIDTTLDTLTPGSGSLNLQNYLSSLGSSLSLSSSTAQLLHVYSDGSMLLVFTSGTSTIVAKMNSAFQVDTTFNTTGYVTIVNTPTVNDMYVNDGANGDNCAYLVGTNGTTPWAVKITTSGAVTQFTLPNTLSLISVSRIRKSANGRMLITGSTGAASRVVAYVPDGSALDLTFGNGTGYYTNANLTGKTIADIAINQYDEMFIAYKNGSNIQVDRIEPNGSGLATALWTTGTPGTLTITPSVAFSTTQIRLFVDETYDNSTYNLIVAAQDGTSGSNKIIVNRYRTSGDATSTGSTFLTVASKVLNLSDLFIDTTPTNYDIYAIGYNATDNYGVVGRITTTATTLSMDSSYGSSGIANVNTSGMTTVAAAGLHPDRRVYLFGTGAGPTPYMARIFGDAYVIEVQKENAVGAQGAIDLSLDGFRTTSPQGAITISGLSGYTAQAVYSNTNGTSYIACGNGTNARIAKIDADGMVVSSGFGTAGITSSIAMSTLTSMVVAANGDISLCGLNAGSFTGILYSSAGVYQSIFGTNGTITMTAATRIAQQKSSRYIISSYDSRSSKGVLTGWRNTGLADSTYGPQGSSGFYSIAYNAVIDDFVLDSNDNAYIVYRLPGNFHVYVEKIIANGSARDATFNGGAPLDTGLVGVADSTRPAHIGINVDGNILVGVSDTSTVYLQLFNGTTGTTTVNALMTTVQPITGGNPILTQIVGVQDNFLPSSNFVASLYQSTGGSPSMVAARVLGDGINTGDLDTGFGTSGVAIIDTTAPISATSMNSISVQQDGKISMAGGNGSSPVFIRLYAEQYVPESAQYPKASPTGTLDTTLNPPLGALNLATYSTLTGLSLSGYSLVSIFTNFNYADKFLLLFVNSTGFKLVRIFKTFALDTTFGASGVVSVTGLTGVTNATNLFVNSNFQIFVTGGSSNSFVRAFNADGSVLTGWTNPTSNVPTRAYAIQQETTSRIIVAGQDTNGVLYAYTPSGSLDNSFGTAGRYDTGLTTPILDCVIDSNNYIYMVSVSSGTSVLQKIYSNGSGQVAGFTAGTAISSITGNNIQLTLDQYGNLLVAAATTNGFTIARYNSTTGTLIGSQLTITAGGSSTSVLGQLYSVYNASSSNYKTMLIGYETTGNQQVIARLSYDASSTLSFDTSFGTNGVYAQRPGVNLTAYGASTYQDNRIYVGGYNGTDPYLTRVFGDAYVFEVLNSPDPANPGTLDTSYHAPTGSFNIGTLNGTITNSMPQATLSTTDGGHYTAFNNGSTASQLIKTTSADLLDSTYNGAGVTAGVGAAAPVGVQAMMLDGSNRIVLVGTNGTPRGWIQRYTTTGALDTSFATTGLLIDTNMNGANAVVQQTLARYVVAGYNSSGNATLAGYTDAGAVDTTFGSNGKYVFTGITNQIYGMVADQYDRLIVAYLNNISGNVDLVRFTSSGQLDLTFGDVAGSYNTGIKTSVLTGLNGDASSVRVVVDNLNHIVLTAVASGVTSVKIAILDNGIAANNNGASIYSRTPITGLTGAIVTCIVAIADNYTLVAGYESGNNPMWIARINNIGLLDTSFNPLSTGASPASPGILRFIVSSSAQTARVLNSMAILPNGEISFVGYENNIGTITPYMAQAYNSPYQTAVAESPNSLPIGTHDITLGLNNPNSLAFYAYSGATSAKQQVARAIGLQGNGGIFVGLDGQSSSGTNSYAFLTKFTTDGTLDTTFSSTGQLQLPNLYQNEYVQDLVSFTTPAGVNKALIAGYAASGAPLSATTSWLMQYNLDTAAVDTTFGGINGAAPGTASGAIKQLNAIGLQSTGRAIASGLYYDNTGTIVGYTPAGKLDNSFGSQGFYFTPATTGIYSHAIDSKNRIVFAYNNGSGTVIVARLLADGSGLDTTFNSTGTITTPITGISTSPTDQIRVALNNSDQVYVAAVNNSGQNYAVYQYDVNGSVLAGPGNATGANLGGGSPVLTIAKLLVDANNQVIIVGADAQTGGHYLIVQLTSALTLDTTFNSTGYVKYVVNSTLTTARTATNGLLHPDGRVLMTGSES